jgi:L-malate glycosyltransferase
MRILFCNFHAGYGGGHDTYILSLASALQADHDIALASPASSQLYLSLNQTIPCFDINYKAVFKNGCQLSKLRRFKLWLEKYRFDIIHVNGSACHRTILLLYPFLTYKPKLIFTKHNALTIKWGAKIRMRYTDTIITVSRYTQKQLLQAGVAAKSIQLIPNGVDTDFYRPIASTQKQLLRRKYNLSDDDFVFVSNAGTADYKNWPHLIAAVAALPSRLKNRIKIIIAGPHPSALEIAENVKKFDLITQVIFPGFIPDIRTIIGIGNIGFVLSNAVETISFACREMMAMGLPVIVSNFGGLPENITPKYDGWVVPTNDIPSLTRLLITILTQLTQKDLMQMSQHARTKSIQQFDKKYFIDATLQVYKDTLGIKK